MKNYHFLALIAMILISITGPLVKFVMGKIPAIHALMISTIVMLLVYFILCYLSGESIFKYFTLEKESLALYCVGFLFSVALLIYFKSMGMGPLSVVVPIWSLQAVVVAIIGFTFLGEAITFFRILGIILAMGSIWCITRPV